MAEFRRREGLPGVEARRSCRENTCCRPHAHDSFSIGAVDTGSSVLTGPLGTRLEPGDVIVIPAGQVHACNPDHGQWRYLMIHVDQDWATCLMPGRGSSRLFDGIRVLRHPDPHSRVSALTDTIFTEGPVKRSPHSSRTCSPSSKTSSLSMPRWPSRIRTSSFVSPRSFGGCARTCRTRPTDLAESIGVAKYQLIRAMRRATGLSPLAWRQNARIVRVRHMLRQGRQIAETAHMLGFADQSHFHRVFRAHLAASPGSYRE